METLNAPHRYLLQPYRYPQTQQVSFRDLPMNSEFTGEHGLQSFCIASWVTYLIRYTHTQTER